MNDATTIESLQAEVSRLRQQVAALEAQLQVAPKKTESDAGIQSMYQALVEHAIDGISIALPDGIMIYANDAFQRMTGFGEQIIGMNFIDLYPPEAQAQVLSEAMPAMQHEGKWQGQLPMRRPNGTYWDMQMNAVALTDANGEGRLVAFVRDVTAQQQAEAERLALQQQLIEAQATALRELSTPLIPITNGVVAMPLVGTIDSSRAQQIMETLLEGIGTHVAETAILDITGVRIVDTQVAQALLQAAQAARLLGAQVVLTGIRPEVAQALVHLGADLHTMVTHSNLQSGIAYALETAQVT